ncbi:bestrophin-like domain [Roseixanthobacter liquoris]|uniref:bestrophin-like domain n=1 Tax=Roseixanthobacter liquoris TaxID=3119921 RepID=UPI0037277534
MDIWISIVATFAVMLLAAGAGSMLARRLPEAWLGEGSIMSLKASMAMVSTMSALLLGLMVNSARYNFSEAYSDVQKYAASIQLTDLDLLNYGPAACDLRHTLQEYGQQLLAETWQNNADFSQVRTEGSALKVILRFDSQVRALVPGTESQTQARLSLLAFAHQLVEYRWKVSGLARTATPTIFIAVVICWFSLIFLYLGVFAPRNPLVAVGHVLAMIAISAAIFLVIEMGEPFDGLIQVSPGPLVRLLHRMEAEPCPAPLAPAAQPG